MESLNQKIKQLEDENMRLREEIEMSGAKENLFCNQKVANKVKDERFNSLEDDPVKMLQYLKTILGYSIRVSDNVFTLRSVYSFSEQDVFEVEIQNNKLILRSTDYLNEWTEYLNTYVKNGRSYCAFFAAVTLELFNRKTFG